MRKIDELVQDAWLSGDDFKLGNTELKDDMLFLHGNKIAYKTGNGKLFISLAGWDTNVTRDRINAILPMGYTLKCNQGNTYLNNVALDCYKWYTIQYGEILEVADDGI